MAERQIGLRIKLNGLNTVITDIQTLEDEIRKAKEDLKQVEIGSDIFKELASEISTAQGQLQKLNQSAEGISTEKAVEGFSKLGAGISSSFAAATAAVALFGTESETVQKAAADAQNLLTLALSIRGVAELRTGAQIVARTIAEKAGTLATNAANVATKAFYTTLAANPYGAILAVVGLLITAYLSFSNSTDEANESTKDFNTTLEVNLELLEKERSSLENNLSLKLKIAEKEGASIEEVSRIRQQAFKDQIKLNNDEIKLLEANNEANTRFILANLDNEEELAEVRTKISENAGKISSLKLKNDRLENESKIESLNLEIQQEKIRKDLFQKNQERIKKRREEFLKLIDTEIKLTTQLLNAGIKLNEVDNETIQLSDNRLSAAKGYSNELLRLRNFTTRYKEVLEELSPVQDKFGQALNQSKLFGELLIEQLDTQTLSTEESTKALEKFDNKVRAFGKSANLSPEQFTLLLDFTSKYKELFNIFGSLQKFKDGPLPFKIEDFEQVVTDLNLTLGNLTFDPYGRSEEEINAAKLTAKTRYEILKKQFVDEYTLYLEDQYRKKGLTDEEINLRRETTKELASASFEQLSNIGNELLKFEEGVTKTQKKLSENNFKLIELEGEALRGFILQNAEAIVDEFDVVISKTLATTENLNSLREKLRKKDYSQEEKYKNDLISLEENLKKQGVDITNLSYEEKLLLLEKYLNKEIVEIETAETKKQEAFKKTIGVIQDGLSTFNDYVSEVASLTAQYYDFQLTKLEDNFNKQSELVIGDTEEANKKRLELEEQYQAKKSEIEKKAYVKSLQFQLAQSIADGAQAVLANLEFPPLAILTGILAAAQVGIVAQQLAYAQSLAGGGKIRMGAGGMLIGKSHEQGGIYAGGVNLEGGETVVNRVSALNYAGLLSQINQNGGGAPIVPNASNSLMEERLVQAMAKMKNEPIRAYVLSSEITNSQAINKRLEELSTI